MAKQNKDSISRVAMDAIRKYAEQGQVGKDPKDERPDTSWIKDAVKQNGVIREEFGVPEGAKISASKMRKAKHAGGKIGQLAKFAEVLKRASK